MEFIAEDPILEFQPGALEVIRRAIGMDRKMMAESIDALEEWVRKQNHFIKKVFDRGYLERTIQACKGSVEKAKVQIDKMCTVRTLLPKFFINCDVKGDLKTVSEIAWVLPLPKTTKDHCRVCMWKVNAKELTPANFTEFYRLNFVFCEYLKAHDFVNGFIIVDDYRDLDIMELLTKSNMVEFQQFMTILSEGYGARLLGIHLLVQSKLIDLLIATVKQFLTPKIASRLHVHQTLESVYEYVDKDILPEEYGGKERSIERLNRDWLEILSTEEHKKYMSMMNAAGTDESVRQTGRFNEEYLGMPGTFRTLSVD